MIKRLAKKSRFLRYLARQYRLKTRQPDWESLLNKDKNLWMEALKDSKNGPLVLVPTSIGGNLAATTLESLLSVALTLRGAEMHILLCDSVLPACMECWVGWYPNNEQFVKDGPHKDLCKGCFSSASKMFLSLGLVVHRYSDFITEEDLQKAENITSSVQYSEISKLTLDEIAVGEHAMAGTLRFYARGTLDEEPYAEKVLRRYLKASLITTFVIKNLLKRFEYNSAVFHHGIYVPMGLIGEVCRREGIRVVNWNPAYRKKCFIFSHQDTYHHTMIDEPLNNWTNLNLDDIKESELMSYLKSRWKGTKDWIWFHEKPRFELSQIRHELNIDISSPCIGLLTSVMWDAQLHYPSNAFPNMLDWVLRTIEYFIKRPDVTLIIRVHPAEINGMLPSRQRIADEIKRFFPELPSNIIIVPPESRISTYALMLQCNTVIIYNTKTGVELTSMGIPVIVAGEAWIRNKGFSIDVSDPESYFELLDKLPLKRKMSNEDIQKARKYAYHFFFRCMIPIDYMEPTGDNPPFRINLAGLNDLLTAKSSGLDIICNGIINGTDFIYPAERIYPQR